MTMHQYSGRHFSLLVFLLQLGAFHGAAGALVRRCHCKHGIEAFSRIDAEYADITDGVESEFNKSGMGFAGGIQQGDVFGFCRVRFEDGAYGLQIRVSSNSIAINHLALHLDSPDAPAFDVVDIGCTDSLATFSVVDVFLRYNPKGIHDLYFTSTNNKHSDKSVFHVDWFKFLNATQIM